MVQGSPPRVRGKVHVCHCSLVCCRITPACAGKSRARKAAAAVRRDHPRVCEEKNFLLLMTSRRSGSPPRVRGKGWGGIDGIRLEGITPACAGKSCFVHLVESFHWDHPRVCGEKQASCPEAPLFAGSPPRVRGKGIQPRYHRVAMGITPACAGKSNICGQNRVKSEDHPRACGEKHTAK